MNLKDKTVVIDNKTYRYSKIVMLPTEDKTSVINLDNDDELIHINQYVPRLKYGNQHLYFLSTDKICEGDRVWYPYFNSIHQANVNNLEANIHNKCLKVISSTDPSLNLPKPSDSFLQVYIDAYNKDEKIEECLVEYEEYATETTYNLGIDCSIPLFRPKTTKGEITIRKVKDSWSRDEVITKLRDAYLDIVEGGYSKGLNQWISENL